MTREADGESDVTGEPGSGGAADSAQRTGATGSHRVEQHRPIYIGGLDRTGKTTMRAFLASHPNISIPAVGSNMWTYFYRQYGDLSKPQNFEKCLQDMLRYKHVRFLEPDEARIRSEFAAGPWTYADLFSLFLRHHAERSGKARWGAQSGLIERYAAPLFAAHPDLRIVQMIRDPRDRYDASLTLWPEGRGRAGGAAARFVYSARLASANVTRFGAQRYRVVRFEDMVARPEETIREVCEFLGEEFHPEMMSMPEAPELRAKMNPEQPAESGAALSIEYVGLYRGRVPAVEVEFIERAAGRSMRHYGYEPADHADSPSVTILHRLRTWISQGARFAAWIGLELLRQRLPRLFRRRPGARMVVSDNAETVVSDNGNTVVSDNGEEPT